MAMGFTMSSAQISQIGGGTQTSSDLINCEEFGRHKEIQATGRFTI